MLWNWRDKRYELIKESRLRHCEWFNNFNLHSIDANVFFIEREKDGFKNWLHSYFKNQVAVNGEKYNGKYNIEYYHSTPEFPEEGIIPYLYGKGNTISYQDRMNLANEEFGGVDDIF